MVSKAKKFKAKQRALKAKEKGLRRASSVIRSTGDQVMSAAEDVTNAMRSARNAGYLAGVRDANRCVNDSRTIGVARIRLGDLLAEAESGVSDAEA